MLLVAPAVTDCLLAVRDPELFRYRPRARWGLDEKVVGGDSSSAMARNQLSALGRCNRFCIPNDKVSTSIQVAAHSNAVK